jgi:Zn ribbon nucleic-acid-binding protein
MASGNNKVYETFLKEDQHIKGVKYKKGTRMVLGAVCPHCKKHHPKCIRVVYCNHCGYRSKSLKPHEEKKKAKMLKRMEYEKKLAEVK